MRKRFSVCKRIELIKKSGLLQNRKENAAALVLLFRTEQKMLISSTEMRNLCQGKWCSPDGAA